MVLKNQVSGFATTPTRGARRDAVFPESVRQTPNLIDGWPADDLLGVILAR